MLYLPIFLWLKAKWGSLYLERKQRHLLLLIWTIFLHCYQYERQTYELQIPKGFICLNNSEILPNQNIPTYSFTQVFQFIKPTLKESYVHLPQYPIVKECPFHHVKIVILIFRKIMKIKIVKLPGIYLLSYVIFSKISETYWGYPALLKLKIICNISRSIR